jgi:hypothetical protein
MPYKDIFNTKSSEFITLNKDEIRHISDLISRFMMT